MEEEKLKEFEEVTSGNLWIPEDKDQEIEGEVVKIGISTFDDKKKSVTIKAQSGTEFLLPNHLVLENKLDEIIIGDYVKVTYLGEVKGKKGTLYKDYKVEKAK